MKVLQIIHGYPMLYNAGSEVYTQTLCHGLVNESLEVAVFSREEDPFKVDYALQVKTELVNNKVIKLYLVNAARQKDRFVSEGIDEQFRKVLKEFNPDIAHIQHLNHLSLTIVEILFQLSIPIVFTLHDFWLACPRGQFIQVNYGMDNPYALCDGQDDRKCAIHCYSRFMTGLDNLLDIEVEYWSSWVNSRQNLIRSIVKYTDAFIAPSYTVLDRLQQELYIPEDKLIYLDYGFDTERLSNRSRTKEERFVFGYIGTHIVAKGIDLLIKAFSKLDQPATLRIWGRKRGETTPYLETLIKDLKIPEYLTIEWLPEYDNHNIVSDVFNKTDAIVVPSIWLENSPLVIHEAIQSKVLVITADIGGMSEYVRDKVNGLLFKHRDVESLTSVMKFALHNTELVKTYSLKGYLQSDDGNIINVKKHSSDIISIYNKLINKKFMQESEISNE